MKSDHQMRIERFMILAGQSIPDKPTEPDEKTRVLRAKLIMEETLETLSKGLGVSVFDIGNQVNLEMKNLGFKITGKFDMEETADGVADVSVVSVGTLCACGISDHEIIEEVDENNLAKFGPGSSVREDGKLIKPKDHKPPRIKEILQKQGWKCV